MPDVPGANERPTIGASPQRHGRGQRPRGGIITIATTTGIPTTPLLLVANGTNLTGSVNSTMLNISLLNNPSDDDIDSAATHYDYQASFIQWVIICSTILAIAVGSATIMYIRKALNWDYRVKVKRMIRQRKLDLVESRKVRKVRTNWQTPEEFLDAYKQREAQQEQLRQRQRPDGPAGMSNKQLWYEYENLRRRKKAGSYHYTSLKAFELAEKNFIKDCLPFDHNRVKLPLDPTVPCSDYINGSFVDSYSSPNFYLAIQGPFEASIVDFWRVVWLHKTRCIVMLCEPFEFATRQCFRYWPETGKSMSYEDIDVSCESIHRNLDFTYRKFVVSHVGSRTPLEVMHCQYKNWPQFGQPDVYTFLHFIYLIRSFNLDLKPVIVHSKTGSDRTGLFIAIDYCLESICTDNIVNVHETVRRIRRCRAGLVSAIEQYEFVYEAVRVFLLTGITEVPVKYVGKFAHLLGQPMNNMPQTGFDQHNEILARLRRNLTQNDSATGIMSENRWVSRDATCLPPDEYRAHLITGRKGCHDYINAVICNGYLKHNTYIVTQWPIITTMKDFWRMVYDYGIVSTVVLSDVSTGIRYPKFWPVKRGKRRLFDVVSVNLEAKEKRIWGTEYSYTMRQWEGFVDMKAVLMKAGEAAAAVPKGEGRTLGKWISKLFLVNGWKPNSPQADRNESIIEVLLEVEKWQKEAGPEKFICVVSTDGAQQCGVFLTLHMAHQQMLHDFKVDVMSTALAIRKTRPQLLPTREEYEYAWRLTGELQKQISADSLEQQNFIGGHGMFPDVHEKPIPGLCSRCWFCQHKSKLGSSTGTKNKMKLISSKHRDKSPPKQPDQSLEPIEDDIFAEQAQQQSDLEEQQQQQQQSQQFQQQSQSQEEEQQQQTAAITMEEEEKQPFISNNATDNQTSNDNANPSKMSMLTIVPPTLNYYDTTSNPAPLSPPANANNMMMMEQGGGGYHMPMMSPGAPFSPGPSFSPGPPFSPGPSFQMPPNTSTTTSPMGMAPQMSPMMAHHHYYDQNQNQNLYIGQPPQLLSQYSPQFPSSPYSQQQMSPGFHFPQLQSQSQSQQHHQQLLLQTAMPTVAATAGMAAFAVGLPSSQQPPVLSPRQRAPMLGQVNRQSAFSQRSEDENAF